VVTLLDIRAAADVIRGSVMETPCVLSRTLSEMIGVEVYIKFENLQFTASFKDRGALVKLSSLSPSQRAKGVVAASAGNHAQGVAYHARRLGVPAVIVMPRFTPNVKVARTQELGAEILLEGESFDDAKSFAVRLGEQRGLEFISAYDDEKIIAGQGTVGLEMLAQQPGLEAMIVPVGGGGLISGIAIAAKALNPDIEIVGVEVARFPAMYHAIAGGEPVFGLSTIADGIAVKEPGKLTRAIIRELVDGIDLVEEGDIEQAIVMLLDIEKTVAEGAGAAALATLLKNRRRFAGRKTGIVLSGGNIDPLMLASIIERGMVRSGRLARLTVELRDLPGALARATACLGRLNANIEEVHHQRAFTHVSVQSVEVMFVVQTRGPEHIAKIIAALKAEGFGARLENG
jgi:threonine dehydratase